MIESRTHHGRRLKLLWALLAGDLIVMACAAGALIWSSELARFGILSIALRDPAPASIGQDTADSAAKAGPPVGRAAPDFSLKTLDGRELALSTLRGRPVLINFWASWCAPCRAEIPELVRIYEAHKADGLMVVGINLTAQDALPDVRAFVKEFAVTFPVLLDETGAVANEQYHLRGIPMSVLVDRTGIVRSMQIGGMTREQLDAAIAELLK